MKENIQEAIVLKVGDVIEVEGNFFIINKQNIDDGMNRKYSRYNLRTLLRKEKMDKLHEYLKKTGRMRS